MLFSRVHFTREPISALLDLLVKPLCFFRGYRSVFFFFYCCLLQEVGGKGYLGKRHFLALLFFFFFLH